jgi:hypothetical protein
VDLPRRLGYTRKEHFDLGIGKSKCCLLNSADLPNLPDRAINTGRDPLFGRFGSSLRAGGCSVNSVSNESARARKAVFSRRALHTTVQIRIESDGSNNDFLLRQCRSPNP